QQISADQSADYADNQIPDQAKSTAFHYETGEPSRYQADQDKPENAHSIAPFGRQRNAVCNRPARFGRLQIIYSAASSLLRRVFISASTAFQSPTSRKRLRCHSAPDSNLSTGRNASRNGPSPISAAIGSSLRISSATSCRSCRRFPDGVRM